MKLTENAVNQTSNQLIPKHVAIIMDGNGRWAKKRGKLRISGHRAGVKSVQRTVRFAVKQGITSLTLYAFSSENWNRPKQEVSALMELFIRALDKEVKNLHKNNVKLTIIGDISKFSERLQKKIKHAEELTANNNGLMLNIAANYGGRWDIIHAVKTVITQVQDGLISLESIDETQFCQYLMLKNQPDVDLVIRTGGEHRISNFLLWQIAYAELFFTEVLWPDFDEQTFEGALNAFAQRERRFGNIPPV